jgi:hypothetical protein
MDFLANAPIANILILSGLIFVAVGLFGRIGGFIGSIFGNIEAGKSSRLLAGGMGVVLISGGAWLHVSSNKKAIPVSTAASGAPPAAAEQSSQVSGGAAAQGVHHAKTPLNRSAASTSKANAIPPVSTVAAGASPAPAIAQSTQASGSALAPPHQLYSPEQTLPDQLVSPAQPAVAHEVDGNPFVGKWVNQVPGPDRLHWFQISQTGRYFTIHLWVTCSPKSDCDNGSHNLDVHGQSATYSLKVGNQNRVGMMSFEAPGRLHLTMNMFNLASQATHQANWVFAKSN